MKNTFTYNRIFIPEFFSTVLISISVAMFTGFWFSDNLAGVENINKTISIVIYTVFLLFAIFLSIYFRKKYSFFIVDNTGIERRASWYSAPFIGFDQISDVTECYGEFFGKESRSLHLHLDDGETIVIYDYIYQYNKLRSIIEKHKGIIPKSPFLEKGHFVNFARENYKSLAEKLATQSTNRDNVFGNPIHFHRIVIETGRRLLCLLPVCLVDFYLKIMIDTVFKEEKVGDATFLSYYSSAISLIISMIVARYIYFNLFSHEKSVILKNHKDLES